MMYEVAHLDVFKDELLKAIDVQTKNSNFIKVAIELKTFDFLKDVMVKLFNSGKNAGNFKRHLQSLRKKGLIAHDDYSIAFF
jgi:hypothetical protein